MVTGAFLVHGSELSTLGSFVPYEGSRQTSWCITNECSVFSTGYPSCYHRTRSIGKVLRIVRIPKMLRTVRVLRVLVVLEGKELRMLKK